MALTPKQKRHLRALAHHLDPVVHVGKAGLTEAVLAKVDAELENHELIKVRVEREAPITAADAGAELAGSTRSGLAQVIGRIAVLYRRRQEKPEIKLPSE